MDIRETLIGLVKNGQLSENEFKALVNGIICLSNSNDFNVCRTYESAYVKTAKAMVEEMNKTA